MVLLVDDRNIFVLLNNVGNHLHATIFRTVVDDDDLEAVVIQSLHEDALYARTDVLLYLIDWNDDAKI